VTPVIERRWRLKEQQRKSETRRHGRKEQSKRVKEIGRRSEERKRKSQREREKKVLPRNHAPRSPTDFYVRIEDGEGERRGNPWDARGPHLHRQTYLSFSLSLSLSLSSPSPTKVEMYTYTHIHRTSPRISSPRKYVAILRHARATSRLSSRRLRAPEERTGGQGNGILKRFNLSESGTVRFSYDSIRAHGRPRLCRRRLLVYAYQMHATRKSVPFHQAATERVMAADNKRSTFPFFSASGIARQ